MVKMALTGAGCVITAARALSKYAAFDRSLVNPSLVASAPAGAASKNAAPISKIWARLSFVCFIDCDIKLFSIHPFYWAGSVLMAMALFFKAALWLLRHQEA